MFTNLRTLLQEIRARIDHDLLVSPEDHHFFCERIRNLDAPERLLLEEKIYQLDWNIGFAGVFRSLQDLGVVCITNYILRQKDRGEIENILNDLLEVEYFLLADLIDFYCGTSNNATVLAIRVYIDDFFNNLLADLNKNPNAVKANYLKELKVHLSSVPLQTIRTMHRKLFLTTFKSTIFETLPKQKEWQEEFNRDAQTGRTMLMQECVINEKVHTELENLLELVKDPKFEDWKGLLGFLSLFAQLNDHDIFMAFKKFLKETFTNSIANKSKHSFLVVMLIGRQLCYSKSKSFEYKTWYKQTIGEIVYNNKISREAFQLIMSYLTEMIKFENDQDLINVHITTAISAPAKCNELVLSFKRCTRNRLQKLEEPSVVDENQFFDETDDPDVTIVI